MTPPFRIPLQSSIRVAAPAKQSVPAPLKIKKLASNQAARSTSQSDEVRARLERRVEVLDAQLAESDTKVAQLVEDNHLLRECSEKGLNLLHGCRSRFQRQMAHDARVWDALVISEAQAAFATEQSISMLDLVEKAVGVAVCELAKGGMPKSSSCTSTKVEQLVARASVAAEIFGVHSTDLHVQISPLLVDLMPWCGIKDCAFQGVPALQQLVDCRAAQHRTCAVIDQFIALFHKTEQAILSLTASKLRLGKL